MCFKKRPEPEPETISFCMFSGSLHTLGDLTSPMTIPLTSGRAPVVVLLLGLLTYSPLVSLTALLSRSVCLSAVKLPPSVWLQIRSLCQSCEIN
jgi:hypothetical protein